MDALLILHQLLNWLGECRSRPRRAWRLVFSGNRTSRRLRSAPPVPSALPPSGVSLVDARSPPPACSPLPSLPLKEDFFWRASALPCIWDLFWGEGGHMFFTAIGRYLSGPVWYSFKLSLWPQMRPHCEGFCPKDTWRERFSFFNFLFYIGL